MLLKDVIAIMDSGQEFSIGFRTYSKTKDTGGEWRSFHRCRKKQDSSPAQATPGVSITETNKKHPNHFAHFTRNIVVLPNGEIVKIRLRLVRKFNGKTVI